MTLRTLRRLAPALMLTTLLAACGTDDPVVTEPDAAEEVVDGATDDATPDEGEEEPADAPAAFPVTVTSDVGDTTIDAEPTAIISLSPAATEILFAIGAGDQVVAVDSLSTFPEGTPVVEDLAAFEPNVEALIALEPDLVVASFDANDLVAGLDAAGIPVVLQAAPLDLAGAYAQWDTLGAATGNAAAATTLAAQTQQELDDLTAGAPGAGLTYYHELDSTYFSLTSATFIGEVYGLFGLENVADPADPDGAAFGYPQLSPEYLVEADPDLVFLACTIFCGEDATSFAARDGVGQLSAVVADAVVELDDDVASRWGPRIVEFAAAIAEGIAAVDTP